MIMKATVGTCTVPKPGILDFVAKAKWEAWSQLTGMEKSEAEVQYVQLVDELLGRQESQGETSDLVTTIEDGVMTIKFNRPKKKNALSIQMYKDIIADLDAAAANNSVRVVVLTGEGEYYSSGNDLKNVAVLGKPGGLELAYKGADLLRDFINSFISFPKPLIAAVNGPAVGVAVTTLALCDFVYASDQSTFHTPFASLAITAEGCSTYLFQRIMGTARASEVLLYGRKLSAVEANNWGLTSDVIPHSNFRDEVNKRSKHLASLPPEACQLTKKLSSDTMVDQLKAANQREVEVLKGRFTSKEAIQAAMNFFSKK
jgi:peroxisomal 3,2-trans-enoyl-CoA isomerase